MERTLMQVYVKESDRAVKFYQEAFDATLGSNYPNPDGTFYHSELDVYGQILAVAERNSDDDAADNEQITGNIMQFCLHFQPDEESLVRKAYDVLKEEATILFPLGPCDYSPLMTDLIDQYGVRWCIFL